VWGWGEYGQLGLGDNIRRLTPTQLGTEAAFGGSKVQMAACGTSHTLFLTGEGMLWACGDGIGGRLGLNDESVRLSPTRVGPQHFGGACVTTVAAGFTHSAALTEDGKLYTWGSGEVDVNAKDPTMR